MAARNQLRALRNHPGLSKFCIPSERITYKKDKHVQLGVGSYGRVVELDIHGAICAGKIMHEVLVAQGRDSEKIAQKYVEECQLMSDIRHPNIVQFLGLCFLPDESSLPVLVLERLLTSFDDLLEKKPKEENRIPLCIKRSILADVAKGLIYLHNHDPPVIHRDLSARNVLLNSSMQAKISDLGNARIIDLRIAQKSMTRMPGAPTYMPPEAAGGECQDYGPQLDSFSFGHLALFAVTQVFPGEVLPPTYTDPYRRVLGRSEIERREKYIRLLHQQLDEQHPLTQLVIQCLGNEPSERPSAEEILRQLESMRGQIESAYEHLTKLEMMKKLEDKDAKAQQVQLQQTLNEATNPEQLQSIRDRVERYRLERDQVRKQTEEVQARLQLLEVDNQSQQKLTQELQMARETSEQQIAHLRNDVSMWEQEARASGSKLQEYETRMRHYREERDQARVSTRALEVQLNALQSTVNDEAVESKQLQLQLREQLETVMKERDSLRENCERMMTQLQQDREELAIKLLELQEQLETVTKERDSLLENRERVTAQWEGRIRRLEQQLKAYQRGETPAEYGPPDSLLGFNVSQLQQDREELALGYEEKLLELQEQLETVTKERDSLLENRGRVTAQWEGRIRRLEQQLKAYQRGETPAEVDAVSGGGSQSAIAELESQVTIGGGDTHYDTGGGGYYGSRSRHYSTSSASGGKCKSTDGLTTSDFEYHPQYQAEEPPRSKLEHGGGEASASASAGATADTSTVQFMWQPLTEMTYPKITLLASFECGSVELSLVNDSYYASNHVTVKKGTYEGQLVIGDSFVNPVKNFTIEKDDDMVILQFEVSRDGSHGEQGSHYGGGQYGSGYMQRNPSCSQGGNYGNQGYSNYQDTGTYGYGTTGSGDTRYGTSAGGDTRYGTSAGGDTRYGTSAGGDTHYGTGGGGYYDSRSRQYGTSSASGGKYKSPDGLPTSDFEYHPQYPATYNDPRNSPLGEASATSRDHTFAQAPIMQEAGGHASQSNTFSRQLSAEGFSPVQVKSKGRVPSGTTIPTSGYMPDNSRPSPSSSHSIITGMSTSSATSSISKSQSVAHSSHLSRKETPLVVRVPYASSQTGLNDMNATSVATYNDPRNSPLGEASATSRDHTFAQAPIMQEAGGHASQSNTFSRQLSAEGFSPVQVKSKGRVPSGTSKLHMEQY